jgi:beta-barrel assembly-enhancing protease
VTEIPGDLLDGAHSTPIRVGLLLEPDALVIRGSAFPEARRIPIRDVLHLDQVGAQFQCTLKNPEQNTQQRDIPEWVLTYMDPDFHKNLVSAHFQTLHPVRQTWKWVGGFPVWKLALLSAVCLVVLFQAALFGLQYAYRITPDAYDRHLGAKVDSTLSKWSPPCQSPSLDTFFVKALDRMALPSDRFPHRVVLLNDPTQNAIAIPGGTIYVYRGLLETSASPDEILGVIGHEISHSELRHTVRQIIQSMGASYFITLVAGMAIEGYDMLEGLESTLEMGSIFLTLRYSRSFEAEADSMGITRMHQAGLKVGPLDTLLTRLSPKPRWTDKFLSWFSTHPMGEERSARFQAARGRETFAPDTIFARERENWNSLKRSCVAPSDSTPIWKKLLR